LRESNLNRLDQNVITQSLKNAADAVRLAGDDAAHPDEVGPVSPADARQADPAPDGQPARGTLRDARATGRSSGAGTHSLR